MSTALEILLAGLPYHGGAQMIYSNISHMRRWLALEHISESARHKRCTVAQVPPRSPTRRIRIVLRHACILLRRRAP